jgi:uncharacterized protein with GYD domain
LKKNVKTTLPFAHLPMEGGQRGFEGQILKQDEELKYSLVLPDRQLFVQLAKFTPGKGPKDWVAFHKSMNERRHAMGIHEIATFLTWGRYDMVVIWDAPDVKTYNEFLASWLNPQGVERPVESDTHVVSCAIKHD